MKKIQKKSVFRLVFAALFLALGVLFPQVFHLFGMTAGQILLPMHLPVMIAGYILGPVYGGIVGVLSPVLSCLFTGMPTPVKMPFMLFELGVYGFTAGIFDHLVQKKIGAKPFSVYLSLIPVQLAGRIANALCILVALYILKIQNPAVSLISVWTSLVAGIPGILLQWLLVPVLVLAVRKIADKGLRQG